MEHPPFLKHSHKTHCFESSHWKKQHFKIALYTKLLAVILVSLQLLKQDACSHIRKRQLLVKEWYQKQDVPHADNLTQCFWAIPYKFSTRWSIKYNSKPLEKDTHLKTVTFSISEGEKNYSFFLSPWTHLVQILCNTGGQVTLSWHLSKVSLMDTAKTSLLCPLWPLTFRVCVCICVSEGSTSCSSLTTICNSSISWVTLT